MRASIVSEAAAGIASGLRCSLAQSTRSRASNAPRACTSYNRTFSSRSRLLLDNAAGNQTRQTPVSPRAPAPATATAISSNSGSAPTEQPQLRSLTEGLDDPPPVLNEDEKQVDWTRSFHGLSASPFSDKAIDTLTAEIPMDDIEIKPDGIIYLPEIKYRRILNKAFGPGGWGLAPRGETIITGKVVTREYGLVAGGRLVSIARGEQAYFDPDGIPTATEGCKSNSLMRCCKDLGIASELWDPRYIKRYLAANARETIVEHAVTKKRRKHWMRKDDTINYPWKEVAVPGQGGQTQNQTFRRA